MFTYPITGIPLQPNATGEAPRPVVRVEVDDFFSQPEHAVQKDLLYLALTKFKAMPFDDKLSYFQVAGVHSLPQTTWDEPGKEGEFHTAYCEHGTILFATWHRPYMALFEQRLYEIMVNEIIPYYPSSMRQEKYDAARAFRFPYWDWAVKKTRLVNGKPTKAYDVPQIVKDKMVQVSTISGGFTYIPNPFYNFNAKCQMDAWGITPVKVQENPDVYAPFDKAHATSRYPPDPRENEESFKKFCYGIQNNDLVDKAIEEAHWHPELSTKWGLKQAVHRLLTQDYFATYAQFVTTTKADGLKDEKYTLSLEGIHNNLHDWTGGDFGHMASVPVAAFDPIFWLHHTNVDRILAIWQTLHADKWFESFEVIDKDTGKVKRTVTPDTPLTPFHYGESGETYDSNKARDFHKFGYTYPELQEWKFDNHEEYLESIRRNVDMLYGPNAEAQKAIAHIDVIINVFFEKFALGGIPFTVSVLLDGEVVGMVENFSFVPETAPNGQSACANCSQLSDAKAVVGGQVFITHELVKHVHNPDKPLDVLDREPISDYLKKHLDYKVTLQTGRVVPKDEMPSLKVYPIIGRREVSEIKKHVPDGVEGGMVPRKRPVRLNNGIVDLPHITPKRLLSHAKAEWTANRSVIRIKDGEDHHDLEIGPFSKYEALWE